MPPGTSYSPPGQVEDARAERDPEAGQSPEAEVSGPNAGSGASPTINADPAPAAVDLLDTVEAGQTKPSNDGTIHELD